MQDVFQNIEKLKQSASLAVAAAAAGDDDLVFRVWAPGAQELSVKIMGPDGREQVYPLKADTERVWSTALPGLWKKSQGSAYVYQIKTAEGKILERAGAFHRLMHSHGVASNLCIGVKPAISGPGIAAHAWVEFPEGHPLLDDEHHSFGVLRPSGPTAPTNPK